MTTGVIFPSRPVKLKYAQTGAEGLFFENRGRGVVVEGVYACVFGADAMWKIFATTGQQSPLQYIFKA